MQKVLAISIIFFVLACRSQLAMASPLQHYQVVEKLKTLQVHQQKEIFEQLEILDTVSHNSCARVYADFFRLYMRFHSFENITLVDELGALRTEIINCGDEDLLYRIDLLLADIYGVSSELAKLYDLLRYSMNYLDTKSNVLKRTNLMYRSGVFKSYFKTTEAHEDLLFLLEKKPWSVYHNRLCFPVLSYYYRQGQKQQAHDFFEFASQKIRETNDLVSLLLFLDLHVRNQISAGCHIEEVKPFIDEILHLGESISDYYTVIAHFRIGDIYYADKQYLEAYEAYKKAKPIIEKYDAKFWKALVNVYMGWSFFQCNPNQNLKKAEAYYFRAMELADEPHHLKIIVDRIFKSYQKVGHPDTRKYEIKLAELYIDSENTFNSTFNVQELKNYLQIGLKEAKIKELELSNKMEQASLQRLRYIIGFGILVLGLSIAIYNNYRKNIKTLNQLKARQAELKKLNTDIATKNDTIEKQRVQLESLLDKLRDSNQSLGSFAQVAAHDVKSPLRTIHSFSSMLYQKYKDKVTNSDQHTFDFIIRSCIELQDLVTNLLQFSEVSTNLDEKITDIDLNLVLEKIQFSHSQQIEETNAELRIKPGIPTVRGFHTFIELLFNNLFSASLSLAHPERNLVVQLDWKVLPDDIIQFQLCDNGLGIDRSVTSNVFEIFGDGATSTPDDWSICLATAKEIIDRHHCRIWIDEQPNTQGTKIFFTLPLKKTAST